jgi:hypothetical protein
MPPERQAANDGIRSNILESPGYFVADIKLGVMATSTTLVQKAKLVLASPVWQGIGALLSLIAVGASLYVWLAQAGELAVVALGPTQLVIRPSSNNIELRPNEPAPPGASATDVVLLKNRGLRAIKPDDFLVPVAIAETTLKIMQVSACPTAIHVNAKNYPIPAHWEQEERRWKLAPLLLNPGETICTIIVYDAPFQTGMSRNNFAVTGRIVDVHLRQFLTTSDFQARDFEYLFAVHVQLSGAQIPLFLGLQVIFFLVGHRLFELSGLLQSESWTRRFNMVLLVLLATASAEGIVFLVADGIEHAHVIVLPLLVAHAALYIYLTFRIMMRNQRTQSLPEAGP